MKSAKHARDEERRAQFVERRGEERLKARASRIDPRVSSITVGTKHGWSESQDESNWCKLSAKFFTIEKIKKIKITVDSRTKSKAIKFRTDIHFDDITHVQVAEDYSSITFETRIPTLFEVGLPIANEDGAITTDWQEGRALEWQLPAKNPHPNRYHIVFKEGAFKEEHLAIFMSSDPRIKSIIQKENAKFAEVSRGAKRSRDDSKASSSKEDEEGDDDAAEEKKDKPVKKKAKISETASPVPTSTKPVKEEKKKPKKNEMQVDEKPKTEESTTKAAPSKTEKKKPVAKKADAAKTEDKDSSKPVKAVKKAKEPVVAAEKMEVDDEKPAVSTPAKKDIKSPKKSEESKEKKAVVVVAAETPEKSKNAAAAVKKTPLKSPKKQ
mgnify:FL=1